MSAADDIGEILLFDEIADDSWPAFDAELKALGAVKNINLRINSPGGNVFDAMAIFNAIKQHSAEVTATVDGIAASAASLIAMAADKIVMPENSFMLIHQPSGMTIGTSDDHATMAANLQRMTDQFASVYATRSRNSLSSVKALMREDRLMTAAEAKKSGYCDEVTDNVRMAAMFEPSKLPPRTAKAFNKALALSASMADHKGEWRRLQAIVKAQMGIRA
ncbi:head maturation protease, ClpP-related [Bradyrhizobium sp. AZCC 2289]|uniref:head maturation protease, ClpP-related n=1 Tax=Bradyrhizobium sp. AZCC 2289 TaxID=3117026 RepID=UPI002FF43485